MIFHTYLAYSAKKIVVYLTIYRLVFACVNGRRKTPLQIHFTYLGNKEIHCIFKVCCIISILFFHKMPFIKYFYLFLLQ